MGVLIRAAVLLLLFAAGAQGAGKKAARVDLPWSKNVKEAKAEAKKSKKPIAVCFIQKKCRLSIQMVRALHTDGRIYAIKDRFVWLCVDPGRKDDFKWFIGLCGDAVEGTPTFFFLNHKGEYADPLFAGLEPATGADPETLIAAFRTVVGRMDKDSTKKDWWATAGQKKKDADACAKADTAKAIALYREALFLGYGYPGWMTLNQQCRAALETLIQKGMAEVRALIAKKAPADEKKKAFQDVAARYPDTDVSYWAVQELEKLGKKK